MSKAIHIFHVVFFHVANLAGDEEMTDDRDDTAIREHQQIVSTMAGIVFNARVLRRLLDTTQQQQSAAEDTGETEKLKGRSSIINIYYTSHAA